MISNKEFGYVFATKMLVNSNLTVGFMYREMPDTEKNYSGWCFFTGNETQEYCDNAANIGLYSINTILEIDPSIEKYLSSDPNHAFERFGREFKEVEFDFDFE